MSHLPLLVIETNNTSGHGSFGVIRKVKRKIDGKVNKYLVNIDNLWANKTSDLVSKRNQLCEDDSSRKRAARC